MVEYDGNKICDERQVMNDTSRDKIYCIEKLISQSALVSQKNRAEHFGRGLKRKEEEEKKKING